MRIELHISDLSDVRLLERNYDLHEDDIRSILFDICRVIAGWSDFVVSGFGQDRWPVEVTTDLPVFLEQLPSVLRAVRDGVDTRIDFYEQGVERSIELTSNGDIYVVKCVSNTSWEPNPVIDSVNRRMLEDMLLALRDVFMASFAEVAPGLVNHSWVKEWLAGSFEY
jgi:hypothetical protein